MAQDLPKDFISGEKDEKGHDHRNEVFALVKTRSLAGAKDGSSAQ
jgi:hypothetical protein